MFNLELFLNITRDLPDFDKKEEKEIISKEVRLFINNRDGCACKLCGVEGMFGYERYGISGDLAIHHIIPNGNATPENLITLCKSCHQLVHLMLYKLGKWKWVLFR